MSRVHSPKDFRRDNLPMHRVSVRTKSERDRYTVRKRERDDSNEEKERSL